MKKLRPRLTYANVMATVAVFLALGGISYAAIKLPKNSVGTKQLKKNAVTTAKIKNAAVTGAKVDISTLGAVPNATHATSADSAASAGNAENLGGTPASNYVEADLEAVHIVGEPGEPLFEHEARNHSNPKFARVGFYKDLSGIVHLQGYLVVENSESAFTLPPGFRPQQYQLFDDMSSLETGVRIDPNGQVHLFNILEASLGSVMFRTD